MADKWNTLKVLCEGGIILNQDSLYQAESLPGSAIRLTNFEPSVSGGYARIEGYTKYSTTAVTGSGDIKGTFVFNNGVMTMRGTEVYFGTGTTWTAINGADTRTGSLKYRAVRYTWSTDRIVACDQINRPFRYTSAGTYTLLTNAPTGIKFVEEFKRHLFLANGELLTFSAPGDENNYLPAAGAGTINVGFAITGIKSWRGQLYVFGERNISTISGTNSTDFALEPITKEIGCIAADTIQEVSGDLFYLSADGVRTIAGTSRNGDTELANVSRQISPLFNALTKTNLSTVVIRDKSQYRLFRATTSTPRNLAQGIVGGLKLSTSGLIWEWTQLQGIKVFCADSGYITNGIELVVFGNEDGYVYQMEFGSTFDSTAIPAQYQTPYLVMNDPNVRKTLYKVCTFIRKSGSFNLTLGVDLEYSLANLPQPYDIPFDLADVGFAVWDDGVTVYDSTFIYDSPQDIWACVNAIGSGNNISLLFTSNGGSVYNIRSFNVQYALNGRR